MFNVWKNYKDNEDGAAIIFGLLFGLVGFGLAYIMMVSTITSLNVASTTMMTSRLQQAAETGVNNAMTLIHAGYNFKAHTISNPFTGADRITHQSTNVQTSNIHWEWWVTPFDLTNRTDCQVNGVSVNYNCGYYLYSKATAPSLSENAEVTVRAILVPTPIATAEKTTNGAISYGARNVSLARHGVYGLQGVSLGEGVKLYSYYSVDSNTGAPFPTTPTQSNNKVSLASNSNITIQNTAMTDTRMAAYNLYRNGDFVNGDPQYATCGFNGTNNCNSIKHNKQAYAFTFDAHEEWMSDSCSNFSTEFATDTVINTGVTCINGDTTLATNPVEGNAATPSILIINGNLTIDANAQINLDKAPHFLQIYVSGNVTFSSEENASATISAIIMASGSGAGNINIDPAYESSEVTIYGVLVGNTINAIGNVTIWQDLNTKYLKNTLDDVAYQFFSLEITNAVRDIIPISIIGNIYGEGFVIDSSRNDLAGVGQ
jgi:hypothetical protein